MVGLILGIVGGTAAIGVAAVVAYNVRQARLERKTTTKTATKKTSTPQFIMGGPGVGIDTVTTLGTVDEEDDESAPAGESCAGPPPSMDPFPYVRYQKAGVPFGGYASIWGSDGSVSVSTGIETVPGDVGISVIDLNPEIGGTFGEAADTVALYNVIASREAPVDGIEIVAVNLDKRFGGSDKVEYRYPGEAGTHTRRKDRGDLWPKSWRRRPLYLYWRDFPPSSPYYQLGQMAEAVAGMGPDVGTDSRPYLVCRARNDRTPSRDQVELIRIGKMHKHFKDIGQVYGPVVFDFIDSALTTFGAAFGVTGLAASLVTTTTSIFRRAIQLGAVGGSINSWRQAYDFLKEEMSFQQMGQLATELGFQVPSKIKAAAEAAAAVPGATQFTRLAAHVVAVNHVAGIYNASESWKKAGSPSQLHAVTLFT